MTYLNFLLCNRDGHPSWGFINWTETLRGKFGQTTSFMWSRLTDKVLLWQLLIWCSGTSGTLLIEISSVVYADVQPVLSQVEDGCPLLRVVGDGGRHLCRQPHNHPIMMHSISLNIWHDVDPHVEGELPDGAPGGYHSHNVSPGHIHRVLPHNY